MAIYTCRFGGPLASGEVFSTGFHVSSIGDIDGILNEMKIWATDVWNGTAFEGIGQLNPPTTNLSSVVVYQLSSADNRTVDKREADLNLPGTGTASPLPNQLALCVSLLTATLTRAGRGRMFWPAPDSTHLTAQGRVPTAVTDIYSEAIGGAMHTLGIHSVFPVIHSAGRVDRPITGVVVGDVYDTQRRRRDQLVETRGLLTPLPTGIAMGRAPIDDETPSARLAGAGIV